MQHNWTYTSRERHITFTFFSCATTEMFVLVACLRSESTLTTRWQYSIARHCWWRPFAACFFTVSKTPRDIYAPRVFHALYCVCMRRLYSSKRSFKPKWTTIIRQHQWKKNLSTLHLLRATSILLGKYSKSTLSPRLHQRQGNVVVILRP